MKIRQIIEKGRKVLSDEHDAKEKDKLGILRGGNAGVVLNGHVVGNCPRLSLLRAKGVNAPIPPNRISMFDAGVYNEDIVYNDLKHGYDGPILREEEVSIEWEIEGVKVTGRPDMVLCERTTNGGIKTKYGLELKNVSSVWTAISVGVKREPKTNHIIQAAHYAYKLDIPFTLYYASRVDWPMTDFMCKLTKGYTRDFFEYRNDKVFKLVPFDCMFDLRWADNGHLEVKHEAETAWNTLHITKESIEDYYKLIAKSLNDNIIPPRPSKYDHNGNKMRYNQCDPKYCAFAEVCDRHENSSFECWFDYSSNIMEEK